MIEEIENKISEMFENKQINNAGLVHIIEHCGAYLNLKTISDYAKANGLSYNGVKKCRQNITIFNTKYIIDNE
jgi:hypothetical protein